MKFMEQLNEIKKLLQKQDSRLYGKGDNLPVNDKIINIRHHKTNNTIVNNTIEKSISNFATKELIKTKILPAADKKSNR